jgi:hypothetical protein
MTHELFVLHAPEGQRSAHITDDGTLVVSFRHQTQETALTGYTDLVSEITATQAAVDHGEEGAAEHLAMLHGHREKAHATITVHAHDAIEQLAAEAFREDEAYLAQLRAARAAEEEAVQASIKRQQEEAVKAFQHAVDLGVGKALAERDAAAAEPSLAESDPPAAP